MEIRNIAIIAHVDHGKTTLVDAMLKQTKTFRENQKEMDEILIMDSNDLEREKGITILAKNTAVFYKNTKINIIDTPGHADFAGEVERTINMASGAILLVDSAEGPLPQTKFVLKKALETHLKIILIINKIDKKDSRSKEVLTQIENLFLELAHNEKSLHFITLYAVGRDGKVFHKLPHHYTKETPGDLVPLFETILKEVPNAAVNKDKPFQMLISTLDYDNYVGKLCIGKINQGKLEKNNNITLVDEERTIGTYKVQKLYTFEGLQKKEVDRVSSGDVVAIAGIAKLTIGQTVADPQYPLSLPKIYIEEPTIKVTIGPNTSPFSGHEGKLGSSRQIKERLLKEKETNLGLKIEMDPQGANFIVAGRGELHLSILIETMRREGFELQVSKPQVIYKNIKGKVQEPYEEVLISANKEFLGILTEELGKRKAELLDMKTSDNTVSLKYKISENNLLGIRSTLLTKTSGTSVINTYFLGYFDKGEKLDSIRNGDLIAVKPGEATIFGLVNSQERGVLFVRPGEKIYEGMVVGSNARDIDIEVNVCKEKKLTNNRSVREGTFVPLTPLIKLSLEQALDFINEDEYLEVTPLSLRIRKKVLSFVQRRVSKRQEKLLENN
ncbi:translational GTPase TypA [Candidatus Roizmanbacteria bacterium CG22_combo_CG10-13_8_21_14_all_35_9]|uniref:50S ribosomal subunit assembly factor BipA n=4 Tax=Candidatus Roizmaniibacteriota TaxID=1752723 RepID=A0A2M8F1Y5_9BACT|nr:MAG: translational GTPase TypA [Candidatus Roizmanbacteria bacterium CG23_combo_of_CG06-09_8_20_14_all_35_49]PIP62448.1 MAG: translational GTPase TypA [Candidatus Roizmanbacteria bacterium CG22_combo_CG10-13_8_21_14_all_35_9]PIY70734.1 MAG: translational GTPase TypA [Candidatus Roizmanbacteria bacterium CG_4_10_14_0_8_um_filter_35_28]PJC33280.1 MAG: translational GTPase TypA [Candidatus Roizmanbacteria bacterium CG_4_9_14_0_2_um_filter_35_15]PJC82926.1 MAG: translational GTPase TypA [Candida